MVMVLQRKVVKKRYKIAGIPPSFRAVYIVWQKVRQFHVALLRLFPSGGASYCLQGAVYTDN